MYKLSLQALLIIGIALCVLSCNPECESLPGNNIQLPPGPFQAGTEMLISSTPSNFLQGRSISISMAGADPTSAEMLPTRFVEELGGVVVTLPASISNNVSFFVNDPDCSGSVIPISDATSLVDETFFENNPFFVTPAPPLIIIPTIPPAVPPAVVNAWFSPNNRDYCIWFNPTLDTLADGTVREFPTLIPLGDPRGVGPVGGSAELAAGCDGMVDTGDRFYHFNGVSGVVDKENNVIRISIDRTSKGLGIEDYEGQFIDPAQLPDPEYAIGGVCADDDSSQPNIMFLTSVQTKRQMILFRQGD